MKALKHHLRRFLRARGVYVHALDIYGGFYSIIKRLKVGQIRRRWRRLNRHNYTAVGNTARDVYFPLSSVRVGKHTYGTLHILGYGTPGEGLSIGCYRSIASGVTFVLGGGHNLNTFSTYPFRSVFQDRELEALTKGAIIVEDDVWIGTGAMILSGVTLRRGTVVAAGSIVSQSSLAYSIIGGNPAKVIKMRFEPGLIEKLMGIELDLIDEGRMRENIDMLYRPLSADLLDEIMKKLRQTDEK